MRLQAGTAARLPDDVTRPAYDRDAQQCGIVHFGIGAFHRAHQAVYTDDAMNAGDRDWSITGVSLRSPAVAQQINPQDGLYTVTQRSSEGSHRRLIGAVRSVIVAPENHEALIAVLAAPATRIASLTITEKGYCRHADGTLDFSQCDGSIYDYLARAFRRRIDAGMPGLTLLSCDNLADNGAQLGRFMDAYLAHMAPDIRGWFGQECACPSTMIDRIVPATTDADRADLERAIGMRDESAVVSEPFGQWVIEDRFAGPRPRWEVGGAQMTSNVRAFETAKLRMLNGAHSALAYLGLARGYTYVHQAIADPVLGDLAAKLMRDEAAPSIDAAAGQDLVRYAGALIERFSNPALNHRLIQIAMDGSQKIPQRWLETLAFHQERGATCPAILTALAAWIVHVRGDRDPVSDPLAGDLAARWRTAGSTQIVTSLFGENGMFRNVWIATADDAAFLNSAMARD